MRRKPGAVLALEAAILAALVELTRSGHAPGHGFALARHVRDDGGGRQLTAHGTLYKALSRLWWRHRTLVTARAERRPRTPGRA